MSPHTSYSDLLAEARLFALDVLHRLITNPGSIQGPHADIRECRLAATAILSLPLAGSPPHSELGTRNSALLPHLLILLYPLLRMSPPRPALRPAVFLDRDDTILDTRSATANSSHPGDLIDPALVRLLPGAAAAIRRLNDANLPVIVVSNQGAVARGTPQANGEPCTPATVEAVNTRMRALLLETAGARLDAIYICPYHPQGAVPPYNTEHPWRKPQPGMLLAAALDLGLDLPHSWMIGDAQRDIDAALAAGIPRAHALLIDSISSRSFSLSDSANHVLMSGNNRPEVGPRT